MRRAGIVAMGKRELRCEEYKLKAGAERSGNYLERNLRKANHSRSNRSRLTRKRRPRASAHSNRRYAPYLARRNEK